MNNNIVTVASKHASDDKDVVKVIISTHTGQSLLNVLHSHQLLLVAFFIICLARICNLKAQ